MIILARQMARLFGGVAAVIVMMLTVLGPAPAYAVHDTNIFELDGNVLDSPAGTPDDWSSVNDSGGLPNCSTSPPPCLIAKTGTVEDPAPHSIFTGGGSKDDLDIPKWKWKNGSVPDKDDITNAYAAAYNVAGDMVIYFGADRFDNSGDANLGFWFFQKNVSPKDLGSAQSAGFNLNHTVGDLLILATFTGGGTTVSIEVLKWVGTGGNEGGGTLQIISQSNAAKCIAGQGHPADKPYCAITNAQAGEDPPWDYLSKNGTTTFPVATFFEGGINVSDVFGSSTVPCFSSFLAETRSSSEVNAVLKDFVLRAFPVCSVEVTKQCTAVELVDNNTKFKYTIGGTVTNTGFGALSNIQLSDAPPATTGFVDCATKAPVSPPASLTGGQQVCYAGNFLTTEKKPSDTMTVTASTGIGGATVSDTDTANCPDLQLNPAMSVSKVCETHLVAVGGVVKVRVDISGDVCNTGDTPLNNVTASDNKAGALFSGVTLPVAPQNGTSCQSYSKSYFPTSFEPADPGLAKFTDTVTASGTPPAILNLPPVEGSAAAECFLCPVPEN